MPEYLLLLTSNGHANDIDEGAQQEYTAKWTRFMQLLHGEGILLGGKPLKEEVHVLEGPRRLQEMEEGTNAVEGWLHVRARDIRHLAGITETCPIFEYDGRIEIREVMPHGDPVNPSH